MTCSWEQTFRNLIKAEADKAFSRFFLILHIFFLQSNQNSFAEKVGGKNNNNKKKNYTC